MNIKELEKRIECLEQTQEMIASNQVSIANTQDSIVNTQRRIIDRLNRQNTPQQNLVVNICVVSATVLGLGGLYHFLNTLSQISSSL